LYKIVDDATNFFNKNFIIHENKKITPDKNKVSGVIQFFKKSLLC